MLADAFGDLIEADERAFRHKFRKMAASPFAFYRGSAPLFYADVVRLEDPWADERTSPRLDPGRPARRELRHLHGLGGDPRVRRQRLRRGLPRPLHLGPAADGGQPGAAGVRQGAVRRGDRAHDRDLRARVPRAGAGVRDRRPRQRVPAHAREHRRRAARRAAARAAGDARGAARTRPRPSRAPSATSPPGAGVRRLEDDERGGGRAGVRGLSGDDPRGQAPAQRLLRGQGRGRARRVRDRLGRPAGLQPAGRGAHAGAGERRPALDEAGQRGRRVTRGRRSGDPRLLRAPRSPDRRLAAGAAGARRPVAGLVRAAWGRPGGQGGLALRGGHRLGPRRPTSTR